MQYKECMRLMEMVLVVARKECPHQADCARTLMKLGRQKMRQ
jgi:hypothetical protein